MTQETADLLETADVARLFDRTPASIRAMVKAGKIPVAVITPRGARLYRRSDIEALLRTLEGSR